MQAQTHRYPKTMVPSSATFLGSLTDKWAPWQHNIFCSKSLPQLELMPRSLPIVCQTAQVLKNMALD